MTSPHASRIIFVQPVVPSYRKDFFDTIEQSVGEQLTVYSSDEDMGILTQDNLLKDWHKLIGPTKPLFPGAFWQVGALSIPVNKGDIVIISGAPRCLSNIALLVRARLRGARTIWWGQLWSGTTRWHRFLLRLVLMRLAHSVLFYTEKELITYKARFGQKDRRPLGALNNGIDVKPIQQQRASYDEAVRCNTILFLGRLTQKAQIKLLLEAMTQPELTFAKLNVIGDGPDMQVLQAWANQHGLNERVVWHGGIVDESKIAPIANKSAVFCYPGSVGLSLIHAMAYGLPAVVHDQQQAHMPEIAAFNDEVTGKDFAKDDVRTLAITLSRILSNGRKRTLMSAEAIQRADTVFNTNAMAERFAEFIKIVRPPM